MFDELLKTVKEAKDMPAKATKVRMNSVNVSIEKKLGNGKVIRASGYNPKMVIKIFDAFEKENIK